MQVNTNELNGPALDWAVAKCELPQGWPDEEILLGDDTDYSTDWAQGGPIIDQEKIELRHDDAAGWTAEFLDGRGLIEAEGPTPLIAAMRCYVASKLGDTVEIPDELI